jgi:hypothetical protein
MKFCNDSIYLGIDSSILYLKCARVNQECRLSSWQQGVYELRNLAAPLCVRSNGKGLRPNF